MVANEHNPDDDLDGIQVVELTYEEALDMFDKTARRLLNMSGEEFLRRWKEDDFEDPDSSEVTHVGILAPLFIEEE